VLQCPEQTQALIDRLECAPYSRDEHKLSKQVYTNPDITDPVTRAWAFFWQTNGSFAKTIKGGWAFSTRNTAGDFSNKIDTLKAACDRIRRYVQVDNIDALAFIKRWDRPETLFYCDPPYINTDCGHYKGYTQDDYQALLEVLQGIKGKFILSGYDTGLEPAEWITRTKETRMTALNGVNNALRIETIWMNFEPFPSLLTAK